jgi:ATP-dependent RNA helicase DDX27
VLRKAEMEAQKAENLIEHEAEIYARPARTWFQTDKQKKALADLERTSLMSKQDDEDEVGGNAKTRKNNKKAKEREERKRKRAEETAAAKKKSRNSLLEVRGLNPAAVRTLRLNVQVGTGAWVCVQ